MPLTLRRNRSRDLAPLEQMLPDADIPLLNPNAKVPFDEMEWQRKWLGEGQDVSFYLEDDAGRDVGFFALREGIGPEVRHLTYVYLVEEARGGAAAELHVAVQPGLPRARLGAGGVHHVAFRVPDKAALSGWAERLGAARVATSGEIDRFYFRSLYFREPAGNLFELATDGPGFDADEPRDTMGTTLSLPPLVGSWRRRFEEKESPPQ